LHVIDLYAPMGGWCDHLLKRMSVKRMATMGLSAQTTSPVSVR
jgi:hypothetical protein